MGKRSGLRGEQGEVRRDGAQTQVCAWCICLGFACDRHTHPGALSLISSVILCDFSLLRAALLQGKAEGLEDDCLEDS